MVDDEIRDRVGRLGDLRANPYGYDRWGASPADAARSLVVLRWLYRSYFRAESSGIDNVPGGRVLLVGNHSGQLAYDGMMVCAAMMLDAEPPRFVRAMIERFFAHVAYVNTLMTRTGQLTGVPANCERLLVEEDAAVLVFPEGERGGGRVWKDRYKVMGFGQGFVRLAMRTSTPIVPFGFVGGEEMCPSFSRMKPVARLLGVPYVPLTPTLLPVPLPARVHVAFGEPMRFEGSGEEDDDVVLPAVSQVEEAVASLLDRGLRLRGGAFFG
jgi:1-acyl-sn-glycerol-3-phosphate acyltransferase